MTKREAGLAKVDPALQGEQRQQLVLMIDLERCTGCRACEAACKLENRLGEAVFRNRVFWVAPQNDGERWEFIVTVCQQCARPACLRACGAGAISKDAATGVVTIDEHRCTGCQECVLACPYGAMSFDYRRHTAEKCNLCLDRRQTGRGGPACAAACPGRAIGFGDRKALLEEAAACARVTRSVDHFGLSPATIYLEPIPPRRGPRPGDGHGRP